MILSQNYKTRISLLDKHFATLPSEPLRCSVAEQVRNEQVHILELQYLFKRNEIQITMIGAFKAGKSTLLNALLGRQLLPSRTIHATGVITHIQYGQEPVVSALIKESDGRLREQRITFGDLAQYILLDAHPTPAARVPRGVKEVAIHLPLPLLLPHGVLVDTPGLLDDEALTALVLAEVERTDLVVMVLPATQLLSHSEKEIIWRVQTLLSGNIVFVINRLDQIDEEEKEETLDWARSALRGAGNSLVGAPRLFATAASQSLEARKQGKKPADGVRELENWLQSMQRSAQGENIVQVSRLSILEHVLLQARAVFNAYYDEARADEQKLRTQELLLFVQKQKMWEKQRDAYSEALRLCRVRLSALGQSFVNDCQASARQQVEESKQEQWGENISTCVVQHTEEYVNTVQREVYGAIGNATITLPAFQLDGASTNTQMSIEGNAAAKIGVVVGGAIGAIWGPLGIVAGASVGGWFSKALFGVDIKRKTLDAFEQMVQELLATLHTNAERYLNEVERLVVETYDARKVVWKPSNQLSRVQECLMYHKQLVDWCNTFQSAVSNMKKEAIQ